MSNAFLVVVFYATKFRAYAIIMHCPAKRKTAKQRWCCCRSCSYLIHLISFLLVRSVHSSSYTFRSIQSNSISFVDIRILSRADRSASRGSDRHAHQQDNTNSYMAGAVIST